MDNKAIEMFRIYSNNAIPPDQNMLQRTIIYKAKAEIRYKELQDWTRVKLYNETPIYNRKANVVFFEERKKWCSENCTGEWLSNSVLWKCYFVIELQEDAVLFKLTWG